MRHAERLIWLLVGGAIGQQTLWHIQPFAFTFDEVTQIVGARSWSQGYGISLIYARPPDVSTPVIEPLVGWPPGYSLVMGAILGWHNDVVQASVAVKTFAVTAFFVSWWWILWQLRDSIGPWARALTFLWWACVAPPLRRLSSTDVISLALYCAALAVNLWLLRRENRHVAASLLAGALIGLACIFRYAYWPLSMVFPVCLAALAVRFRRRLLPAALAQLAVAGALLGCAAFYKYRTTGHVTWLPQRYGEEARGSLRELKRLPPFPAAAVGLDADLKAAFSRLPMVKTAAQWVEPASWFFSALVLGVCGYRGWRYLKDGEAFAFSAAALSFLTTLAMVAYLTWRYPPDRDNWVFIQEFRYYAPALIFVYLGLAGAVSTWWTPRVAAPVALLALAPLLLTARNSYHDVGRLVGMVTGSTPVPRQKQMMLLVKREVEESSRHGVATVYLDSDRIRRFVAAMTGARMADAAEWDATALTRPEGAVIIAGIPLEVTEEQQVTLRQKLYRLGGVSLGAISGVEFIRLAPVRLQ